MYTGSVKDVGGGREMWSGLLMKMIKKIKSILTIHIHTNIKSFILVLRSTISPVEGFL